MDREMKLDGKQAKPVLEGKATQPQGRQPGKKQGFTF
jgi:hypothetical protein